MSWNSLEKGWGGYSTFRPMRNAEVDEESIDVEEEWEEPESLEGMDPEEAFGYGWVKAAEMMQERLDELMALPDEEDVDDLAKTAAKVTKKEIKENWHGGFKPRGDFWLESDGPAMILYMNSGITDYGAVTALNRNFDLEESERRGRPGNYRFTRPWHSKYPTYPAAYRITHKRAASTKTAGEPDGRGMTEKLKVKLPNVNGLWSEVALGYHPSGTMEIYLDTRKNIDFGFSIYVNRRWGGYRIGDFEKIIRELKKGKMPRGFFLDAGAKFDHVPTKRAAKLPQAENFAYTIPVEDRGNSSEDLFLKEPRYHETREFAESGVLGNDPSVDKGDQATGKPVPPTPTEIIKDTPGSKELSTFSRYLIQTDHDVKGIPEHRDDVEKHPDLVQEQDGEAEGKTAGGYPFGPGDKVKVEWDFGDTDFEDLPYKQALRKSRLPEKVRIPQWLVDEFFEEDEDEGLIDDWLSDEYGFTHHGWSKRGSSSLMDDFKRVKGLAEKLPDNDFLTSVLKQISEGHDISPKQEAVIEKIKGQVGDMTKMQEQLKSMKHKKAFAGWTLTKFSQKS
jgi:hypothetical protein